MKFGAAYLALYLLLATTDTVRVIAFSRTSIQARQSSSASSSNCKQLSATATTVATSFEEDLALTLKVILDHEARSTTVSKDQFLSQMKEAEKMDESPEAVEPVDLSIPYNAAALLAYEAAGSKGDFATFEAKYLDDTVAMVTAKKAQRDAATAQDPDKARPAASKKTDPAAPTAVHDTDLSIAYDAAAKLAYAAAGSPGDYADFKANYEAQAVAAVIAKRNDISVPYDAAAALAFTKSNRKMPYALFKAQYEADARAAVQAKNDLSVPYDAAAMLEYVRSDRSQSLEEFKEKYQADAIQKVIAKKQARDAA